jgi:hypothetical protein
MHTVAWAKLNAVFQQNEKRVAMALVRIAIFRGQGQVGYTSLVAKGLHEGWVDLNLAGPRRGVDSRWSLGGLAK